MSRMCDAFLDLIPVGFAVGGSYSNISSLSDDAIEIIASGLTLKELYRFMRTCRTFASPSELVWNNLCIALYPQEFWEKAAKRPVEISRPLFSARKELERMKKFEALQRREGVVWTINDYYTMWGAQTSSNQNTIV